MKISGEKLYLVVAIEHMTLVCDIDAMGTATVDTETRHGIYGPFDSYEEREAMHAKIIEMFFNSHRGTLEIYRLTRIKRSWISDDLRDCKRLAAAIAFAKKNWNNIPKIQTRGYLLEKLEKPRRPIGKHRVANVKNQEFNSEPPCHSRGFLQYLGARRSLSFA